ncbi:MAG: hypothetical protein HKM95_03390 [Inquilinus sp.]|nr:hypothetical protein [Inquilinus sp.]
MDWPPRGAHSAPGLGAERTSRTSALGIIGIANLVTLFFAWSRISGVDGRSYDRSAGPNFSPDATFHGLLALSVVFSVASFFLARYPDKINRIGARICACALPLAVAAMILNRVL